MPDLVVIGHVTCDVIDGNERLGGAASYVSLTAARLGMNVTTVTAAPASFSLLGALSREPRITVERQDSAHATRFALDYSGPVRSVRLLEQANVITRPKATAQFVYLAPVIGEVPYAALAWFPGSAVVIGMQGWMRDANRDGSLKPIDPPEARLLSSASAVCFSEHDHPEPERLAGALAKYVPVVVVTRGMHGATLYDVGGVYRVPAMPASERDPTGAGDVFGAALTVGLWRGSSPMDAAREAAYAAARAVEGPGLGNLR